MLKARDVALCTKTQTLKAGLNKPFELAHMKLDSPTIHVHVHLVCSSMSVGI